MARWIADWRPEDKGFWERTGRRTATRNLVFSIFAEHLGFSVWLLWSTVAVSLNKAGFHFGIAQLFWLVATVLHSSHTENPRCSANIEKTRLRVAVRRPVRSQNPLSSGRQSAIQRAIG